MPIINEMLWDRYVECNREGCGLYIIKLATVAMNILDEDKPIKGFKELIEQAERVVATVEGTINGFIIGEIVKIIILCHSRGEEIKELYGEFLKEIG